MTNKLSFQDRIQIIRTVREACEKKHGDKTYASAYLIGRLSNYLTDKEMRELLKEFQQ